MDEKKKLYLAGPLGFSELGRFALYEKLIPMIENLGFEILNPWELTDESLIKSAQAVKNAHERKKRWQKINAVIASNNFAAIDDCDLMVAVLDGTDVDSGTATEIGYAYALGKPIVGYRGDLRISGDNEGSLINLQVEYCINCDEGKIHTNLDELAKELKFYLDGGYWADDEGEAKEDEASCGEDGDGCGSASQSTNPGRGASTVPESLTMIELGRKK